MKERHGRQVAFVGASGSGKTTLIEAVLPRLSARGLRVGVVKHTHHRVDWDLPGKDSWRFREAGAARVVLVTPELVMSEARLAAADIGSLTGDLDLLVHEGNRSSAVPKLLIGESVEQARAKGTKGEVLAVVGVPGCRGVKRYDRDDVEGVAALLCAYAGRRAPGGDSDFERLLERAVAAHGHLCPGQVLGVRMTMRGLAELGLGVPPPPKRLIAIVETDRCAADAVASVSGCSLGRRTLKHFDFGKMAASFLDLQTGKAVRVVARDDSRELATRRAPEIADVYEAQTAAYRLMPDEELLRVYRIALDLRQTDLPGRPVSRVPCAACGEEISDGREVEAEGGPVCRACAGASYYRRL